MRVGVPKEIKNHEYRVGLSPASVRELCGRGHEVIVERHAGAAIGFLDEDYQGAGADIASAAEEVFARADMIVKVKEPQPDECRRLRENQILFTYLHLAPDPGQARLLIESGATCIAYETVTDSHGGLPLLAPMSEVAGRLAPQMGAHFLEIAHGGRGVMMSGVPGVAPARVTVIGGGVVGFNAANIALGMGAEVTVLERSADRLRRLDTHYCGRVKCIYSTDAAIEKYALDADMVIGAVLIPGAAAPKLMSRELISRMLPGSVLVDVAIDQGGCFETSKATTHADPTYVVDQVIHYCVANMPGAVARTSTMALNNATLRHALALADKGTRAMLEDSNLLAGLNVHQGKVTHRAVAEVLGYPHVPAHQALQGTEVSSAA